MRKQLERLFFETYWACAWRRLTQEEAERLPDDAHQKQYRLIRCDKDSWCADPFVASWAGNTYLLCEKMPKYQKKAVIAAGILTEDGSVCLQPVLSPGCHTSYPAIFFHDGTWYMIPETQNAARIELWRAEEFPVRWTRQAILLENIAAADTTSVQMPDGSVQLLIYEQNEKENVRHLWSAALELPAGRLSELTKRATYSDRRGRPAGNILNCGGKTVRPAQDGRTRYGGAIEFLECSFVDGSYHEACVGRLTTDSVAIDANWKLLGVHTVNRLEDLEVIDVYYRKFAPFRAFAALYRRRKGGRRS